VGAADGEQEREPDEGAGARCSHRVRTRAGHARTRRNELPERAGDETNRITRMAREQGLLLLSCGIYGNVIRILVPFTIGDEELDKGLDILEGLVRGS
jgi:4-aminobutyrate aminotransferase-like enzyme